MSKKGTKNYLYKSLHLTGVGVRADHGGDEGGHPHGVRAGVGVVLVELDEVVDGQHDADDIDGDPEKVNDVVSGERVDHCEWLKHYYRTTGVNILIFPKIVNFPQGQSCRISTPGLVMMRYRKGPWTSGHDGSLGL